MPDSALAALPLIEDIGPEWLLERHREHEARGERPPLHLYLSATVKTPSSDVMVSHYLDLTVDEVLGVLRARKARANLAVVQGG